MSGEAAFAAALFDPEAPAPAGIGQARRFGVYRNNVSSALTGALAVRYPCVQRLVGARFFAAMARVHVIASPPASPVLIHFGGGFPRFIANFAPAAGLPWLADVAALESAWWQAYHAGEADTLQAADFAAIPADRLADTGFTLHPSVRVVSFAHAALSIVAAQRGNGDLAGINLFAPEHGLVHRRGTSIIIEALAENHAAFLAALARGAPLGTALPEDLDPQAALTHFIATAIATGIARP